MAVIVPIKSVQIYAYTGSSNDSNILHTGGRGRHSMLQIKVCLPTKSIKHMQWSLLCNAAHSVFIIKLNWSSVPSRMFL